MVLYALGTGAVPAAGPRGAAAAPGWRVGPCWHRLQRQDSV